MLNLSNQTKIAAENKKTLCIITETKGWGGTEIYTRHLVEFLITKGYHIEFISARHKFYDVFMQTFKSNKIKMFYTELSTTVPNRGSSKGWNDLLRTIESRILIIPKGYNYMGNLFFLKQCRRKFEKIYYVEQLEAEPMETKSSRRWFGGILPGVGLWWYKEVFLRKARSFYANHIIAVSNKVKESLIFSCGYPAKKITVIPNSINWESFTRDEKLGVEFRRRYAITADTFVIGMVARLAEIKGIDIALRAFAILLKQSISRSVKLVIAGRGEKEAELRKLTNDLRIEDHVIFTGFLKNPIEALSAYDVILFSSRLEGLPLGLLEGMAAGCIPIVTRISGMPEIVNSPEIGWVVDPENPEALSVTMHDAVNLGRATIVSKRENAIKMIKTNYDLDQCNQKLIETLNL